METEQLDEKGGDAEAQLGEARETASDSRRDQKGSKASDRAEFGEDRQGRKQGEKFLSRVPWACIERRS
eukprot:3610044-Pleurochrysis_carterae.AAC.1